MRGEPEGADWRERFEAAGERTERAIENLDVGGVFIEVFRRLYELRNQIFYGGVTFAEEWSRTLHRDGTRIMADIVSVILQIMKADIDANPALKPGERSLPPRSTARGGKNRKHRACTALQEEASFSGQSVRAVEFRRSKPYHEKLEDPTLTSKKRRGSLADAEDPRGLFPRRRNRGVRFHRLASESGGERPR